MTRRVRWVGPYGHREKLNIMVAIFGEDYVVGQLARRWVETWNDRETTITRLIAFILRILQSIRPGTPANWHCFTMENLNSHRNILVQQAIHAAGHRCVFRDPYYPVDSPIEHLFNAVQLVLTLAMYRMATLADVKREFLALMQNTSTFARYFEHVGLMN